VPASAAAIARCGVGRLNQSGCHQHSSRREQLLDHDKRPTNFDGLRIGLHLTAKVIVLFGKSASLVRL
jgi:hypothetical protein